MTVNIEILNPEHHIATLSGGAGSKLYMEITINKGRGYVGADKNKKDDQPIGMLPVDSIFTPVTRVNFLVENTRVGQITDYDKLSLEVWTNGTIAPDDAVSFGAKILNEHLNLFIDLSDNAKDTSIMVEKEEGKKEKVLEMSIDETEEKLARLDQSVDEIEKAIEKTGVPIKSICLSGHRKYPLGSHDPKIRERGMEIMEKAICLAARLGVRVIQLAGYDVYYEEGDFQTRDYFKMNLKEAAIMAAKQGVLLGFETMETPFMDTVEKAMAYVKDVDQAYLGVYPDIGNLKNASLLYNVDVNEDIMTGKGHIFATHLKETVPGKYREIPFGTGHTEFVRNIKT